MITEMLRRRHVAALRLPPLPNRRRDPDHPEPHDGPSSYGLTDPELSAYVAHLRAQGWQPWEIARRLTRPPAAA